MHVADRGATASCLLRNACGHDARPAFDDRATSARSSAAQRRAIAALHAQQVAHSSSDRAPSDAALQQPAFDQRRASPPGMRDKRSCDHAAVARPARDQGSPLRGQRTIVLRIVPDASRRTRMRCASEGAALQAAAIGRKKNFLLLMRSEIQQVRYNYGKSYDQRTAIARPGQPIVRPARDCVAHSARRFASDAHAMRERRGGAPSGGDRPKEKLSFVDAI
ncbi:hypothetical protein F511_43671 [Dorcoceras hygrometricum]|uniref:Uncharacterized protein n=1 Tax=Dorcoceras hygrometricum TaxID=472368 RepID=A0A2Z7ATW8_9LAMI|nr:hypothetical protein F511_43671 [Dorcoceras hygrometricum]